MTLSVARVGVRHVGADHDVLRDVSLAVEPGEVLALVGPNGSGKSTLLGAMAGQIAPRAGTVSWAGRPLARMSRRDLGRQMAFLPQDPQCPEGLTVRELVENGRYPHRSFGAQARGVDDTAVRRAIDLMGLADLSGRPVATLSGGERKRAWLGMVLAQAPVLLLLDEPTVALDVLHQWEVLDLLARINRDRGLTVVVVLHDLTQAASLAHRIAVLVRGRIYALGAPEAILDEALMRDVFGVNARVEKRGGQFHFDIQGPAPAIRHF